MIKIPNDFELDRYGLHVRLVREEDAEFIVKIRNTPENVKYIHTTSSNIQDQVDWIRRYKEREAEGTDYYFIFHKDGKPLGVYRLYNIHDGIFTTGSWVFDKSCDKSAPILASIIGIEIAFEDLKLEREESNDGCHVDNKKVDKANKLMGFKENGRRHDESGEWITYSLTREDFYVAKNRMLKLLGY